MRATSASARMGKRHSAFRWTALPHVVRGDDALRTDRGSRFCLEAIVQAALGETPPRRAKRHSSSCPRRRAILDGLLGRRRLDDVAIALAGTEAPARIPAVGPGEHEE